MTMSGGTPAGPPLVNGYLPQGYAYIPDAYSNVPNGPGAIYQYSVGTDGSLTPLSVASFPAGISPSSIVADPTGHFVYTANSGDNTISQFAIGTGGALMPLSPATISLTGVPSGGGNYSLSVDPADHYLYVVTSGLIGQFSIGTDGTLTPLNPSYVSISAAFATGPLAIDPTGAHAYLGGTVPTPGCVVCAPLSYIFQFAVGPDGTLSPLSPASVPAVGTVERTVVAPNGGPAYVLSQCINVNCDGGIYLYTVGVDGELVGMGASAASFTGSNVGPVDLAIDGSGMTAYLIANTFALNGDENDGGLYPYAISSTGMLSAGTQVPLPTGGPIAAEQTYGPNLFVLIGVGGTVCCGHTVAVYSIGSQGELTSIGSTPIAASGPSGMLLVAAH